MLDMTIHDVLKRAANINDFPKVRVNHRVKRANTDIGQIVEIKQTGVGVRFEGLNYNVWFWAESKEDKRSRYMHQLTFVNSINTVELIEQFKSLPNDTERWAWVVGNKDILPTVQLDNDNTAFWIPTGDDEGELLLFEHYIGKSYGIICLLDAVGVASESV